MKNLRLINMLLVSHREKKAKKIEFDPKVTIIQGANDTGKSSVIKDIQYAFGANPHKRHQKWIDAGVALLLRFELDEVPYAIYRHRNSFTLFDNNDKQIGTYSSVTWELAPVLAKLFDFKLKLPDQKDNLVVPPPAYLLLPFYLDQDKGWTDTWCSFTNLNQFPRFKQKISGYHFGLKPDKWYELDANKRKLEGDKDEPTRQIAAIKSVRDRTYEDLSGVDFDIDVENFRKEIERLLKQCDELKHSEAKYKKEITELRTEQIRLEAQIEIVAKTHDELSDDYKFSCGNDEESIGCPTCGAQYENSFSERFEIAKDTETCADLLSSLREDLNKVVKEIAKTNLLLNENSDNILQINNILSEKQGDIKLKDLIELEGKKSLIEHLDQDNEIYRNEIHDIDGLIEDIREKMKKYDDIEHRKNIISKYGENLRKNSFKLDVHSLSDRVFKNINSSIEESGSDLPRAVLAYFFAALSAIQENGNATYFPIVIDAPNQQEQDPVNLKKMLNFILTNLPEGKQLVLGLVDDAGINFGGKVIIFDKKYSVLNEESYKDVTDEIKHFELENLAIQE